MSTKERFRADGPILAPRLFPVEQLATGSDDHYTPPWVFDRLGLTFDLDVCAPPGGIPWIPAARYLTMAEDGLAQPWHGRVWMNPPYGKSSPWVQRFIEHRHGIALLLTVPRQWIADLWRADAAWVFPDDGFGFKFVRWDGKRVDLLWPPFFVAFGEECVEAIGRLGALRVAA